MRATVATTIVDIMSASVSKALMLVHSVDTRRKRINYYRYALKEAMNVKVISIARGAREKILCPPPLNFEFRGAGEFFINAPQIFARGGGGRIPPKFNFQYKALLDVEGRLAQKLDGTGSSEMKVRVVSCGISMLKLTWHTIIFIVLTPKVHCSSSELLARRRRVWFHIQVGAGKA